MTLLGRRIVSLSISGVLHAASFLALTLIPPTDPPGGSPAVGAEQVIVGVLSFPPGEPTVPDAIAHGRRLAGAVPNAEALVMPGFELNVAKIREWQDALFPFLTEDLTPVDRIRSAIEARQNSLTWLTPSPPERRRSGLPPLELSDMDLWHLVDEAWSRRERWDNFVKIATLVAEHDPDEGRAPELLRTHLDQNLLQPYYDAETRDPRFWVMLNLAADHAPIMQFVSAYVRDHPSTRSATELLFLLDEFAQASRDALLMLMATSPERDLRLTMAADSSAYELAVAVRDRYVNRLRELDLQNTDDVRRYYDTMRIRILTTILESTPGGYGAADARYLLGRILWHQNDVAGAMRWWGEIGPDERGMYAPVYSEVLQVMRSRIPLKAAPISALFGAEYRQWLDFSAQRLAEFGYRLDTF